VLDRAIAKAGDGDRMAVPRKLGVCFAVALITRRSQKREFGG
jgi:hypothetical protein